jgi:hypothetical protein
MSKAGPDTLHWAAVEAARQAWRPTHPWHELYSDIKRRHGTAIPAKAAVARKIFIASWPSCPGKLLHSSGRIEAHKRSEKPGQLQPTTCRRRAPKENSAARCPRPRGGADHQHETA